MSQLGASNWFLIGLGIAALILTLERFRRLRTRPSTLSDKAILTAMFFLGWLCIGYATGPITRNFYNIGLAVWHSFVPILIGSLEMIVLTLRVEDVPRRAVRRIMLTAGLASAILLGTWLPGFAFVGPVQRLTTIRPWNLALTIHLAVFHGYAIWGCVQFVVLALIRVPRDFKRRPTYATALFLTGIGAAGFAWMNVMIIYHVLTDDSERAISSVIGLNVIFLGTFVLGCALLAVGERIYDNLTARWRLHGLQQLWERVIELSIYDLRLASHLPAPAQVQRAYVEILDALDTLRVDTTAQLTVDQVADILRSGAVTDDELAPTISQVLPRRASRQ
jgi:hypothetical protein